MRDTQPPITDHEEYLGYQRARDKLTQFVAERETHLFEALAAADQELIEDRRAELLTALRKRQGIIDAIRDYERHQQQSA